MNEGARTTRLSKGEAAKAVRPPEAPPPAGGWSHLTAPERPPKTHSLAVVAREIRCGSCESEPPAGDRLTVVVASDTRTRHRTLNREQE